MDHLLLIAVSPGIGTSGLTLLAESLPKGSVALNALACRPDLPEPVARIAYGRTGGRARAATIRHITDPGRLAHIHDNQPSMRAAACANPHTPVKYLLDAMLEAAPHTTSAMRLRAACNPTTPEPLRRRMLSPGAEALVRSANSALVAVQAHALVAANPWLSDEVWKWQCRAPAIVRALFNQPRAAPGIIEPVMCDGAHIRNIPYASHHPLVRSDVHTHPLDTWTREELREYGHTAANLELLNRGDCTLRDATHALAGWSWAVPEAVVTATGVTRFGAPAILGAKRVADLRKFRTWDTFMSVRARRHASGWLEPLTAHLRHLHLPLSPDSGRSLAVRNQQEAAFVHAPAFFAELVNDPDRARESVDTLRLLADGWEGGTANLLDAALRL